jgi:hypothetical protein
VALEKLHRVKGIFGAGHVPVVSSTIKIEKNVDRSIIESTEGGFRSRDDRKRAEKKSEI